MESKGIRQAHQGSHVGAKQAGCQDPQVHIRARTWNGCDPEFRISSEISLQLHHVSGKLVGIALKIATQRHGDALIRPRCTDRKSTRLELQSLMRISYAVFCLKKKKKITTTIQRI